MQLGTHDTKATVVHYLLDQGIALGTGLALVLGEIVIGVDANVYDASTTIAPNVEM